MKRLELNKSQFRIRKRRKIIESFKLKLIDSLTRKCLRLIELKREREWAFEIGDE